MTAAVDAIAQLDLVLACARLAQRTGGCPVRQGDDVVLVEGRHPLLDPATAVAIDLPLAGVRTLVVSGANAGGKTVALKMLGLAAAMHQCGLRPLARSAQLPVYAQILADVGDEQSIARSLSTFSGHLRSIAAIVSVAGPRTLVLLDEVAAGTDPIEGAALAQALLEALQTRGAQTLATTHYPELKEWAARHEGAENASVGFDAETLAPTYTLTVGRPGASHALQMAARLGLDMQVVEAARASVAPERLELEELLSAAAESERRAASARADADRLRQEARDSRRARGVARDRAAGRDREGARLGPERARACARGGRARAGGRAARARGAAQRDPRGTCIGARTQGRAVDARRAARRARARPAPRRRVRARPPRLERALVARARAPDGAARRRRPRDLPLARRARHDRRDRRRRGRGARRCAARARAARPPLPRSPGPGLVSPEPDVHVRASAPSDVSDELDVRGGRADDAREAARSYVDAAHLAGRPEVRIIHGRGTGALRKAVRDELARHPLVDEAISDSADGATIVRIAGRAPR